MRNVFFCEVLLTCLFLSLAGVHCKTKKSVPGAAEISELNLKKGNVVLCGPANFGTVSFDNTCSESVKKEIDLAISLLHSFEYDEAEKVFAAVIEKEPGCAIAYWGVAMCNYHQVWPTLPTNEELTKGVKAINYAKSIPDKSEMEKDFIDAMSFFYKDYETVDHQKRSRAFTDAMADVYRKYPGNKEAAIFYALALNGSADLQDKTYSNQRKAGEILMALSPGEPDHPGIAHYIIHSYDYPELAAMALPAARKYASIAPSSAHAQHMPSHIFIRLGLWNESIQSDLASVDAAKCYAEAAGIKGHWDEELHGMDYLEYAYLQKGNNRLARQQLEYLLTINDVYPSNFKVAYAFAAIPSRYYLENKMWKEAAGLTFHPVDFPWQNFPWQKAILHFARLLGAVNTGDMLAAKKELQSLEEIHATLLAKKNAYMANQVAIQVDAAKAWILYREGKKEEGLALMRSSADRERKTEKSPVTPCEVLPAEELLADMLLEMKNYSQALATYESELKTHPNRLNALYGAAFCSEKIRDEKKAGYYYHQLVSSTDSLETQRPEVMEARKKIAMK